MTKIITVKIKITAEVSQLNAAGVSVVRSYLFVGSDEASGPGAGRGVLALSEALLKGGASLVNVTREF